ncbi:MAG: hypothetical protein IKK57_06720 [Clostridia bacterium]|nr:hypothetical protein [Clostridia bacterium]
MRKWNVWPLLLALVLLVALPGAYAEGAFSMAGYDDEETGHDWQTNLFFERMEALTGVAPALTQYTTAADWAAAKTAMLSGAQAMPDALFKANLTPQETMAFYEAGKLIDLAPYLEQYAPSLWALLQSHPEWLDAVTLPDGAIVALPYIDELQFNNAMWINKTWLQRYNLSMPTTAAELEELLIFFRDHDMNGNGSSGDEIPLTFASLWDLRFLLHAFGVNANDYYVTTDENGVVSEILTSEENREFLTWLRHLWEEGLLDASGFTGLRSVSGTPDEETEVVYGVMFASSPADIVYSGKVQQYVLLDPLMCEGEQVYRDLTGDVIRGAFAVSSACPEDRIGLILSWVDHLYTEEGFILAAAGVAGEEFDYNDDGTWLWNDVSETLVTITLPNATLHGDATTPGWASVEWQMRMDDKATLHVLTELQRLRSIDSMPYPLVWLSEKDNARVNELIWQIGRYAEQQMVWFVVGDVELTDDTWAEFCQTVKSLGVDEMVSIFQSALN